MTVSELGERRLLARIRARLPAPPPSVVVGIGDDAAVVEAARNARLVLTTDALVEGVHFDRRSRRRPTSVTGAGGQPERLGGHGRRAARGRCSRWRCRTRSEVDDVDGLMDGLVALAGAARRVAVVGGNLTRSPGPLVVDVTAVGDVHPRRVLTRGGGRPGDELYVSGTIGGARGRAGDAAGRRSDGDEPPSGRLRRLHRPLSAPTPRVRLGRAVAQARAARGGDGL